MKVARSLSITLDDGQRLNLSLKEAQTLYTELEKILGERIKEKNGRTGKDKAAGNNRQSIPGMSESKKQKILAHLDKRMTDTPRTLTNLLKGISYSPNHLPLLRELVNAQDKVGIKTKGKRTLYFRKSHKSRSPLATEVKAAAA